MTSFALPDLGEGLPDAEIVSWHVSPGDHVVANQPLVSVETAKAVVEIPSPQAGRILRLHGSPRDVVKVGSVLVEFEDVPGRESATIVGELPEIRGSGEAPRPPMPTERKDVRISPALRVRARELGVDLVQVKGTGPSGAITTADLDAAVLARGGGQIMVLRGARRTMAVNMAKAGAEVVPATVTEEADVTLWPPDTDVTVKLVRAIATAVTAEPHLNAWYDPSGETLHLHEHINLGLAQDTPEGLLVPTLRLIAIRDDLALRQEINRLKAAAVERKLMPSELSGQTITLSNFGMIAGLHAALVIMPPQVAIVGAGRIVERVTLAGGSPKALRLLPLSLTFDHRALTGGEAARFLKAMVRALETISTEQEPKSHD
jgi:pyruvate dehydrogenase E2 component (dihydrolipoamide acetyltransferase)